MTQFQPGQRWISDAEPELGIGTIVTRDARTVTVLFRASLETRRYALASAPLRRARFRPGDQITDIEDRVLTVGKVRELPAGLLEYDALDTDGGIHVIAEADIGHHQAVDTPDQRLLQGNLDKPTRFSLRLAAREHQARLWRSPVTGLQGARIGLVPHQLYIADELGARPSARALLADEVGLGKTIEACLVLHRRIRQGQCRRALILVPDHLLNQWLVELLRRFNLHFSLYDEERCRAIESSNPGDNPFDHAQLVLASPLLLGDEQRLEQALEAGWDLLIVDEAHHLHWTSEAPSPQYRIVERLAARTDSVLLLTATPEQLGREGHFARLRLLDPERFADPQRFLDEESDFRPVADLIERLLASEPVDAERLRAFGVEDPSRPPRELARWLLDLRGTSRLLFRNTREQIAGFPERKLLVHELGDGGEEARRAWLLGLIRELRPLKLLLICHRADTAQALEESLRQKHGIRCAAFHEGMSLVQRDRAAAWFADPDEGAEILLCSEIGSEGRNFQFSHHLVLYDLPASPDLLEQRIGRLDRIGQRETIRIHVPIADAPTRRRLDWYRRATHCFTRPDPAASALHARLGEHIEETIGQGGDAWDRLIETTRRQRDELDARLHAGRDRLLALASCDEDVARPLIERIEQRDRDAGLSAFLEGCLDQFGIDVETHSARRLVARRGDQATPGAFPSIGDDGMLLTYDRDTALAREDTQFLTWDHPLIDEAIDQVTDAGFGRAALAVIRHPTLPPGASLLELIHVVECDGAAHQRARRYLEEALIRVLLDSQGRDLAAHFPHRDLTRLAMRVDQAVARQAIAAQAGQLKPLFTRGDAIATQQLDEIRARSLERLQHHYDDEIARLRELAQRNPNLDERDIDALRAEAAELTESLRQARIRLDAARLIVVGD